MPPPKVIGIYPPDSVTDVAQSLAIDVLGSGAADLLAADVEYRLHLIVQEAKKFMVHGKRNTLLPEDVEHAMEALNVEPVLVPPRPLPQAPFIPVPSTGSGTQLYHIADDEVDFAAYLKEPLPPGLASSAGVKWKAHWLAVEGVQPAIPENPTPSRAGPSRSAATPATGSAALKASAKSQLPSDLQLYFTRITTALIPSVSAAPHLPAPPTDQNTQILPDVERHRLAALASLREDTAISGLLVYIVKWLNESLAKCLAGSLGTLGCLVDAVEAILDNESIFIEPYIHQFLAPLLSVILTVPLGPHPPSSSTPKPDAFDIRSRAADVLGKIATLYGPKYPGLLPRLLHTLTQALESSPFPSPLGATSPPAGRYEGAVLAIASLGPAAVRQAIWQDGQGLERIDALAGQLYMGESAKRKNGLIRATLKALSTLTRRKGDERLGPSPSQQEMSEKLGYHFAAALGGKKAWMGGELLRLQREGAQAMGENGHANGHGNGMEVDTPAA